MANYGYCYHHGLTSDFFCLCVSLWLPKKKGRKIDNIRNIYAEFPILKICWIFNVLLLILLIHQVVSYQMEWCLGSRSVEFVFYFYFFENAGFDMLVVDFACTFQAVTLSKWIYTFPTMDLYRHIQQNILFLFVIFFSVIIGFLFMLN